MDFITALGGFADFGLLFCFSEYITINYTIPCNDAEDYEFIVILQSFALPSAIVALTFAVRELLQPGITYPQLGFATTVIIGLLISMILAWAVDRYHNHLMPSLSKDLP